MGFVTLIILFMLGVVMASMFTSLLRTITIVIGSISLMYYFLVASPERQKELDEKATKFNFSELQVVKEYSSTIKDKIVNIGKEEIKEEIKKDARFN